MTTVTPDSIMQVASGFMASKHLFVANEVGLFECLAEGQATLDDDAILIVGYREWCYKPLCWATMTGTAPSF